MKELRDGVFKTHFLIFSYIFLSNLVKFGIVLQLSAMPDNLRYVFWRKKAFKKVQIFYLKISNRPKIVIFSYHVAVFFAKYTLNMSIFDFWIVFSEI